MPRFVYSVDELPEHIKVVPLDKVRIPLPFALGLYEAATDAELEEFLVDLRHELERRAAETSRAA